MKEGQQDYLMLSVYKVAGPIFFSPGLPWKIPAWLTVHTAAGKARCHEKEGSFENHT